ncbi:D-2-hydroxyacid dehydrogenase [Anaerobacillus alkalidiazotrophicus]|uniref:D-2-hydroxyacid dehydrogenase n=1 Tax=Anaerobacillus alkalidiazotrophicus TaxID=472963 RepID=A0A1S2MBI3_9BACI|nr:D-2-hydroxyacid dehydrogenase [Anaerobacillus alkalidiazotrophicus]OIJ21207.1 D-2-hydroxyacid dehydrogenase [Anaerobacillus alkalidiazotrophicus]
MKVVSSANLKTRLKEKLVSTYPEVSFYFYKNIDEGLTELLDADVLITYGEDLTDEIIKKVNSLKWIMVISAGLDMMPFQAIKEKGILVTNARGIHKIPMAEYTIGMMLQVARQTKQLIQNEQDHTWDRRIPMMELNQKVLGILGTGSIGAEIAKYAQVFNMRTIGFNRSGKEVDGFNEIVTIDNLEKLIKESDFIVSVLPSTSMTNGLLNKKLFDLMEDVIFINIGRGKNVVEKDLISALNQGKVTHAVLDVFVEEPLPKSHPFWDMENVTVTPHLSGISSQYQPRALEIFEENLKLFLKGEKNYLNKIDFDRGY